MQFALLNYPVKVGITSDTDIENMNMMNEAEKGEKILVRGYKLEAKWRMREYCEQNGDVTLNVCLSQKT